MNISSSKQKREQGSILIVTLTLGVILALASVSYLLLVGTQKTVVTRSQTWNAALPMAEAGVEEAMAQVNSQVVFGGYQSFTNFSTSTNPPQNFSPNGWGTGTWGSTNIFGPMSRSLIGGTYSVFITTNDATPSIYSSGSTTVPVTGDTISRSVKVATMLVRLSNVGIGAVGDIDLNGNAIFANSYNSHDPNFSTNGVYKSTMTTTNGDVASVGGLVNIGNRDIDGDLYLGPTATFTANNGDVAGNTYTDFNIQFPPVTLPSALTSLPLTAPVWYTNSSTGNKYFAYVFNTSGNYQIGGNYPIVVNAGVTVAINDTSSSVDMGKLELKGGINNCGTLVLYISVATTIGAAGNTSAPVDAANRPENLWVFGLNNLTEITWSGNSAFVGVIYAPNADVKLNGGGSSDYDIQGSLIGKSITSNGKFSVHYDEYLSRIGPIRGYVPASWQEL
jgi:Tfp pilus assembly protein PilX